VADVAVARGYVAAVGPGLDTARAKKVINARSCIVTPGFIDLHVHVARRHKPGLHAGADPHCVAKGVTTALDAGSFTPEEFPRFLKRHIDAYRTRIYALVRMPDPGGTKATTVKRATETILRYADVLVGVKYHHSQHLPSLALAREAADFAGTLLMAEAYGPPLPHLLDYLKPGDVLTHAFHPSFRTPLFDARGKVFAAVREAVERGVYLDVGHGSRGFGWRTMEQALAQGLQPHTISTDLHGGNEDGPVYDLPTTLSKFLALGLRIEAVIEMATATPARVLGRYGEIGTLATGARADIAVSELREGTFVYLDVLHEERRGRQRIVPRTVVAGGQVYTGPAYEPNAMTHQVEAPLRYLQEPRSSAAN
jgi:dihydroorotase